MARRFRDEDSASSEQSNQDPNITDGALKFHSNRKAGVPWPFPPQARGHHSAEGTDSADHGAPHITTEINRFTPLNYGTPLSKVTSSACNVSRSQPTPNSYVSCIPDNSTMSIKSANERRINTSNGSLVRQFKPNYAAPAIVDQIADLFGTLPDPIRLHERLGEFDGQVMFIGHPNRYISAHQWSSTCFQWESIGRYAHGRGKIEGSLASDRLKDYDRSINALIYFKLAAEAREKLVVDHGWPAEESVEPVPPAVTPATYLAFPSDQPHFAPESSLPLMHVKDSTSQLQQKPALATSSRLPISTDLSDSDDPFITNIVLETTDEPTTSHLRTGTLHIKGSLDLHYTFPKRPVTSPTARMKGNTASSPRSSYIQSLEAVLARTEDTNHRKAIEFVDLTRHAGVPPQGRVVLPRIAPSQPTARSLFPRPGLTVANPHQVVSPDETAGSVYTPVSRVPTRLENSRMLTMTHGVTATTILRYSDPDGSRQAQASEIANGIGKQRPTEQNFKGPFFTQTQPTTNDPTASLSVQMSEEHKLVDWFRDGQRPARQKEYARSLISAASIRTSGRHYGASGDASLDTFSGKYQNTAPFVRLYESLSEYVEDRGKAGGLSYFTRVWKSPSDEMIDHMPGGNNSFFTAVSVSTNAEKATESKCHRGDRTTN